MDVTVIAALALAGVGAWAYASSGADRRKRLGAFADAVVRHRGRHPRRLLWTDDIVRWESRGEGPEVQVSLILHGGGNVALTFSVALPGVGKASESVTHRRGPHPTAKDLWEDAGVRARLDTLEKERGFGGIYLEDEVLYAKWYGRVELERIDNSWIFEAEEDVRRLAVEVARVRGLSVPQGPPCLSCLGHLDKGAGPAGEWVCRACGGRFLPPEIAQYAVFDTLGLGPSSLKEAAADSPWWAERDGPHPFPRPCLVCGVEMRLVVLEDVPADYCHGCGSMWLDKDELEVVTRGRFVTDGRVAQHEGST